MKNLKKEDSANLLFKSQTLGLTKGIGTPLYMSPEQENKKKYDEKVNFEKIKIYC